MTDFGKSEMPHIVRGIYCVGLHPYTYRPGMPALVIGFKSVKPRENSDFRDCYEIMYPDGVIDYIPADSIKNGVYGIAASVAQEDYKGAPS